MNLRRGAALVLAALLGVSCAAHPRVTAPHAVQGPVVHDLRSLADLAAVFDQDRDHPRLVLLLSPT